MTLTLKPFIAFGLGSVLFLAASSAFAQNPAVGLWKTIDDKTGKVKSLVRITESGGELQGKIEKLFRTGDQEQNPKCDACEGVNKDQPIIGMTILYGLKRDGDEFNGGSILDPNNGKLYRSKIKVVDNAKKLEVRGFIGFSIFGRSQIWVREE